MEEGFLFFSFSLTGFRVVEGSNETL